MNRRSFLGCVFIPALSSAARSANELHCDVAILGGSVGGCAAALAVLRQGLQVVLTEETDWLGGQLTSQAVPPDEHPWIEQFGCTRSYRAYRNAVRDFYRQQRPVNAAARALGELNPGNASVSRLAHEPRVSLAVLEMALQPYVQNKQLTILLRHAPVHADVAHDRVSNITVLDRTSGRRRSITASYFLDATELGDLLPLTGAEHVTGAESHAQTGEQHAPAAAQPHNNQSFTFCFAMDYLEGQDHSIDMPSSYKTWRAYVPDLLPPWTGPLLSWTVCDPRTLKARAVFFDPRAQAHAQRGLNLWIYRRILDRANFLPNAYPGDATLVNWPQNDFWLGDLLSASPREREEYLNRAKELSLSLLYWMQTEAPRPDGGEGWKGLRLRKDMVGTEDGLAKAPYIRESRRIQAEFTVLEQHVGTDMRIALTGKPREAVSAARFEDSVGVGCYRIDLHPTAGGANYLDISSLPFQIPLGALVPKRLENLLPACKNLGTTHITNGCYRLHPVEWNIGEAAGAVAAYAIRTRQTPRAIHAKPKRCADFQAELRRQGFELEWPPGVHPV
jgi:hypothetical protein